VAPVLRRVGGGIGRRMVLNEVRRPGTLFALI